MNDTEKLEKLATWFDMWQSKGLWPHSVHEDEIQTDLRRMAEIIKTMGGTLELPYKNEKLKPFEIAVSYHGFVNEDFDNIIKGALISNHFICTAFSFNFKTLERKIIFEKGE